MHPFAVEVKSGADGFLVKMRDGRHLRCVHNNPQVGHMVDYAPHPAIVLKMEDGSDILLPIIVCMWKLTLFSNSINKQMKLSRAVGKISSEFQVSSF